MKADKTTYQDGYRCDFYHSKHEDVVTRNLTQDSGAMILERNSQLRNNPDALKDLTFGRQVMTIPLADYEMLRRKYPELCSTDNQVRSDWYKKFILSSESLPYRVGAT